MRISRITSSLKLSSSEAWKPTKSLISGHAKQTLDVIDDEKFNLAEYMTNSGHKDLFSQWGQSPLHQLEERRSSLSNVHTQEIISCMHNSVEEGIA